ncbi:MAG: glycosyltransferase, partial [Roseibium sp.]|uniref:glycosyltransferase n=1 Tax=Roseibium sp. TaxID=1936156 RepID=UPI00261AF102
TVMTLVGRKLNVPALPTSLQPVMAPTEEFPIGLFGLPNLGSFFNRQSYFLGRRLMKAGLSPLMKPLKDVAGPQIAMPGDQIDGYVPHDGKALCLQAFSRALVPTPKDWTAENWACGYWFTEPDVTYEAQSDLMEFLENGPAPIYLGFGSMPSKNPRELTDKILAALANTGQRAILATGWGGLMKESLPENLEKRVFLLEKAPHSWLFPRCAAIVHHGGAGTTHEAVRWGKPSLVCPVFGDQPFWGAQIHKIGAGPAPIRQKKLTVTNLTSALQDLENPAYRLGAEKAGEIISTEPGARGTASRLIEQFVEIPA